MATLKRAVKAPGSPGGRKLGVSKKQSAAPAAPAKKTVAKATAKKSSSGGRRMSGAAAKAKTNGTRKAASAPAKQSAPAKKAAAQPAPKRNKRMNNTVTHHVVFDLHCKTDDDALQITENLWKWIDLAWHGDRLPEGSNMITVFLGDADFEPVEIPEAS